MLSSLFTQAASWPNAGEYKQFGESDLLRSVSAVLSRYERITL